MCYMNAIGALVPIVGSAVLAGAAVGTMGAAGLSKKIYKYVKGDKTHDGINNKIQTIIAIIFSIGLGLISSISSPAFLFVGLGLALAINTPHIAKLLVKDKESKERLDNIAGIAGGTINSLGLIPLALLSLVLIA